jgi:hypothetical protein
MFDIGHLSHDTMASYKKTRDMAASVPALSKEEPRTFSSVQRAFAFHDSLIRFILPLCSSLHDKSDSGSPILSAVYLVDVSAFGLKQAWDLRTYAQDISKLLAISYPEVVDTVFVSVMQREFCDMLIWNELGLERPVLLRAVMECAKEMD